MNQGTPPRSHSNQDSEPNAGAAPERVERPSSAGSAEPSAAGGAGAGAARPDAPEPHAEALAGWEEPQPEVGDGGRHSTGRRDEARPSAGGQRWDEPRPSAGGQRWEEPGPSGEQRGTEGPREPRRRHPAEEHLFSKRTWVRLVFIVIFAIAWWITEFVLTAVIVIQFLWVLFTGQPNEKLRGFGQSLSRYAYQIFRYMTFNSDERPFPFDLDWPSGGPDSTSS